MKESGQGEVLDMANLTDKLPAETKIIITGITDPEKA